MKTMNFVSGEGERLQSARERKVLTVKGALFAIGMVTGAYLGFTLARNDLDLQAPWDPTIAAGLAALYVIALTIGTIMLRKSIDEVERFRTYKAVAFAGSGYLVAYPVWFMLWKGGFVVEPIHWLLFIGFWLLLMLSSIFYRFK